MSGIDKPSVRHTAHVGRFYYASEVDPYIASLLSEIASLRNMVGNLEKAITESKRKVDDLEMEIFEMDNGEGS